MTLIEFENQHPEIKFPKFTFGWDLFAIDNKSGKVIKFKAGDFYGVSSINENGQVFTNLGPVQWSSLYGQPFYNSEESLLNTIIGESI